MCILLSQTGFRSMAYVLFSISQKANDYSYSVPLISNKSNEILLWMNSMANKAAVSIVNKGTSSVQKFLLLQRIYLRILSLCYIFFAWITHCQSVILFFKMMLKLKKKWKLTKFSAPSAAVYVASVMVNDDWGGAIPAYRPQNY